MDDYGSSSGLIDVGTRAGPVDCLRLYSETPQKRRFRLIPQALSLVPAPIPMPKFVMCCCIVTT